MNKGTTIKTVLQCPKTETIVKVVAIPETRKLSTTQAQQIDYSEIFAVIAVILLAQACLQLAGLLMRSKRG